MRIAWSILSGIAVAACGSDSLDVGSNDSGVVAEVAPLPMLPLGPAPDAGDTTQTWIGHLDKDQFPDGSTMLTIRINFAPGGLVAGSVALGDGSLLAPPTDPNFGYPPGSTGAVTPVEGFPYTIQNGSLAASHLTLQISEYEVWKQWCALQTSYPELPCIGSACSDAAVPFSYTCLPPVPDGSTSTSFGGANGCGYFFRDGGLDPIDCGKLVLCGAGSGQGVCQCSATGCTVWDFTSGIISLDLVLADTTASGTLSGSFGDDAVHFTRTL